MTCAQVIKSILDRCGLQHADGRPLYGYRITDSERLGLTMAVREAYEWSTPESPFETMGLCLLAADALAHAEPSEVGTWAPVLTAVGGDDGYVRLYSVVQRGLRAWKRKLLAHRHNLYLVTLTCEGGLPLRVLRDPTARITQYFAALLKTHETFPGEDVLGQATRMQFELPETLRNVVVAELAARVIAAVSRLRNAYQDLKQRTQALSDDDVRREIPVDLDEQTGRLLLEGLLAEKTPVAAATTGSMSLELFLDIDRSEVVRVPALPRRLHATRIAESIDATPEKLVGRMHLQLELSDGSVRPLAALARVEDDSGLFEVDPYSFQPISRPDLALGGARLLLLVGGKLLGSFVPPGAEPMPLELPWIFEHDPNSHNARLVGVGSWRTKRDAVLVCTPPEHELVATTGKIIRHGDVRGRPLFELRGGEAVWRDGDVIARIRTANEHPGGFHYSLRGAIAGRTSRGEVVWRGMPTILELDSEGIPQRTIPLSQWRVRPLNRPAEPWRVGGLTTWGTVRVRVEEEGITVFGTTIRVAPKGIKISLEGVDERSGWATVLAVSNLEVGVVPQPGLELLHRQSSPGQVRLQLAAPDCEPPQYVELALSDPATRAQVEIEFAFPCRRVGFVGPGQRVLPDGAVISAADLAYTTARALAPGPPQIWDLDLHFGQTTHHLTELAPVPDGSAFLHLSSVATILEHALRCSSDLNGRLQLTLAPRPTYRGRKLLIRRFDISIEPFEERGARVASGDLPRLSTHTLDALRAEALPLFDPGRGRVELPRRAPGNWELADTTFSPGPWLIFVWQGDYLCGRPLLRTLPGEFTPSTDRLAVAMTEFDKPARLEKIGSVCSAIGRDARAPEWELALSFLALLPDVPASAFDVLVALSQQPEATAMAAMLFGADLPLQAWPGMEQLPFLWEAVPIESWRFAAHELATLIPAKGIARHLSWLVSSQLPWLSVLHEVITADIPGLGDPVMPLIRMARTREGQERLLEQCDDLAQTLRTRNEGRQWPNDLSIGLPTMADIRGLRLVGIDQRWEGMPRYVRNLLGIPWQLAATAVIEGAGALTPSDYFAVHRARSFDKQWFEQTHAMALACLIAHQQGEGRFHA